jgi:cytochrome P450
MTERREQDWEPRSKEVLADQQAAHDEMRARCPVAYSDFLGWSLFRHRDVQHVIEDHDSFSNVVSSHLSVPNGMDPPEHTAFRSLIEPFFSAPRMQAFEPQAREIARALLGRIQGVATFDCMQEYALPFAAECQCAFLGWPRDMANQILSWTARIQAATLAQDRGVLAETAKELDALVASMVSARADRQQPRDVTDELIRAQVNGRALSQDELTSIIRNWTVGEVGSLAAALGIVAQFLAEHPEQQARLRSEPALVPDAVEEILRVRGPLVANKRVAKREVTIGGQTIAAGERLSVIWVSANRDAEVFERPEVVRFERDQSRNLLYGAGIHVCPGAPLARLELRVAVEALLDQASSFELQPGAAPSPLTYPLNGFATLPLRRS